jgi:peptidoglycan/LPS O-acetylase OafA/YrhL
LIIALAFPVDTQVHRPITTWPLEWLGFVSYSIYLLHDDASCARLSFQRRGNHIFGWIHTALLLGAELAWRFLEAPARLAVRNGWNRAGLQHKADPAFYDANALVASCS